MKKQTKALVCLALALCFTFSFATPFVGTAFAANPPERIEDVAESYFALFNRVTLENGNYFRKYAKADTLYNLIYFQTNMKYAEEYKRKKLDERFYLDLGEEDFLNLKTNGHIQVLYMATLENDRHGNVINHPFQDKLAAPNAGLYEQCSGTHGAGKLRPKSYYDSRSHFEDGFWSYGSVDAMAPLSSEKKYDQLRLVLNHTGCSDGCGSCYIREQSLILADLTNPVVNRIYTSSDAKGETEKSAFKQGERVYLHMEFSESIRFASNVFPADDIQIELKMMRIDNNQTETGLDVTATLYGIQNDMLSFYLDVPATFKNNVAPNHYIAGISDFSALLGRENQFPLVQVNGEGKAVAHGFNNIPELVSTSSLITDIAGNPYIENGSTEDLAVKCRVDVVKPGVTNVFMSSNKVTAEPREAIAAGVGETLTFSVQFSEVMDIESSDPGSITAKLNITDSSTGRPVTLTGAAVDNAYRNGVNGVEVTKVTFEPVIITGTMQIANSDFGYGDNGCLPIGIDTVSMPGDFKDISQNVMTSVNYVETAAANRVMPSTQIWLDTVAPDVTTNLTKVGEVYTPNFYSQSTTVFTLPISVKDVDFTDSRGHKYQSTAEEQTGSFSFGEAAGATPKGEYGFEYALTNDSGEVTGGWKAAQTGQAISFKQVGETDQGGLNYIHIRLLDSVAYDLEQPALTVKGKDFAGNVKVQEFKLAVDADSSGPVITEQAHAYFVDPATGSGTITATLQLTDLREVNGGQLYYTWVNKGAPIPSTSSTAGWTQKTGVTDGQSITVSLEESGLDTTGGQVERSLIVWAQDCSKKKNQTTQRFEFCLDAALPSLEIKVQQGYNPDPEVTVDFKHSYTGGASTSSATNLTTVIALIADPDAPGYYYMRQCDNYKIGTDFNKDLISGSKDDWYYVKLGEGENTTYTPYAEATSRYGTTYSGTAYDASGTGGSGGLESRGEWLQSVSTDSATTTDKELGELNGEKMYAYSGTSIGDTFDPIDALYTFTEVEKVAALTDDAKINYLSAILGNTYYGDYTVRLIYGYGGVGDYEPKKPLDGAFYSSDNEGNTTWAYIPHGLYINRNRENGKNTASADNFVSEVRYYWQLYGATTNKYALRLNLLNQRLGGTNHNGQAKLTELNMEQPNVYDIVNPDYTGVDYIPKNAVVREESYTFKAVPGITDTHSISISAESVSGESEDASDRSKLFIGEYTGADGGQKYLSTLSNGVLKVEIKNEKNTDYGMDDVLFGDAETWAKLYVYSESGTGELVAEYPLSAAEQFIGIDDEAVRAKLPGGGRLKLRVSVKTLGGQTITKDYDNIYVDLTRLPEFGPAGAESIYTYTDSPFIKTLTNKNYANYDPGNNALGSYDAAIFKMAGAAGHTSTLYFTAKDGGISGSDALEIRVWNATSGVVETAAQNNAAWRALTKVGSDFRLGYTLQKADGAAAAAGTPVSGNLLLMEGENTVNYQIRNENNVVSEIKSATVLLSTSAPELAMGGKPDGSYASEIRPHVKTLQSENGSAGLKVYHLDTGAEFSMGTPADSDKISTLGSHDGRYYYYTVDDFGNYAVAMLNVKERLDTAAPVISGFSVTSPADSSEFTVSATVKEEHLQTVRLYLKVQASGEASAEGVYLPLDMQNSSEQWITTPINGVYHIESTLNGAAGTLALTVTGGFMGETSGEKDRTVSLSAVDGAGNTAEVDETLSGKDSCVGDSTYGLSLDSSGLKLTLRDPVIITSPAGYEAEGKYGREKLLPIFKDGTYPITYLDVAGDSHSIDIEVNKFGDFSMAVTRLPEVITSGSVAISLDISANDKLSKLELPPEITNAVWDTPNKKVTVTVNANTSFDVTLTRGADSVTQTVPVAVTNIDKTTPVGELYWYFAEWGQTYSDAELAAAKAAGKLPSTTSGEVRAWVLADEPVYASSGGTSFLFTQGGPSQHTFSYRDEAGNSGAALTATLPVAIVPVPVPDTAPPTYTVELLSKRLGVYSSLDTYDPAATGTNLSVWLGGIEVAAGFQFKFRISDENLTKLAVLAGPDADTSGVRFDVAQPLPEGADVYGDTLTLSKNGAYTVVLVDAEENKTVIELNMTKIDAAPPTGTWEVKKTGFYSRRIVVSVTDNTDPDNAMRTITAVDASQGFTMGSDGKFYADVFENRNVDFTFADSSGLIGSVRVTVSDIDDTEATASVHWSPSYTNGVDRIETRPPTGPLNYDVTALLTFDKDVDDVAIADAGGGAVLADVAELHLQGSNRALVVFHQNAALSLSFKAMNGKAGAPVQLELTNVIDKTPANVTLVNSPDYTSAPASRIYFEFSADETVTDSEGKRYNAGAKIVKTVTENGTHRFSFTDNAGNVTIKEYAVSNIDDAPPLVLVQSVTQEGTGAKILASMSEAGTLKLIGSNDKPVATEQPVSAPATDAKWQEAGTVIASGFDVVTFTVPQNGSYWLVGEDDAGWVTYQLVSVGVIDSQPPVISLNPVTLSIARGSTEAQLKELLDKGVTATDNVSAAAGITCDYDTTSVNRDVLGTYVVPYTAEDEAGNERKMNRYVVVYDPDALLVKANGVKTSPASAVVLSGATVNFEVSNLPVTGEPYKIYVMAGRRTEGQMKRGTLLTGSSFTATESGMYTVMILTQSRKTYVTKIYLQF